jgi:transcriptional regulator with XRE-family HTH domain
MKKTIRQLREDRGESPQQLAAALGATLRDIQDLENGVDGPSLTRLRLLTEHFGVREEDINLEPNRPPSLGEQLHDALTDRVPEPVTWWGWLRAVAGHMLWPSTQRRGARHRGGAALPRPGLADGGLTVMPVNIDVDIRTPRGRPRHARRGVHVAGPGKPDDSRRDAGRDPNHDGGDGRDDDRHRLGRDGRDAPSPEGEEGGDQANAPRAT